MGKQQASKTTASQKRKPLSSPTVAKKKGSRGVKGNTDPKFPASTATMPGTVYEMILEMSVTQTTKEIRVPKEPVQTSQRALDLKGRVFKAGSATILLKVTDTEGPPVREMVLPIEAGDVELILKLLGVVEP